MQQFPGTHHAKFQELVLKHLQTSSRKSKLSKMESDQITAISHSSHFSYQPHGQNRIPMTHLYQASDALGKLHALQMQVSVKNAMDTIQSKNKTHEPNSCWKICKYP